MPNYSHVPDVAEGNCGWHLQSDGGTILYCRKPFGYSHINHDFVPAVHGFSPSPVAAELLGKPKPEVAAMKLSKMFPRWFKKEAQVPESLNQFSPALQDWIKQNKLKITPTKTGQLVAEKLPNADPNAHPLHGKTFKNYGAAEDALTNSGATLGKIIDPKKPGDPPRAVFNHPQQGRFVISGWGDQAPKGQSKDFVIQHIPAKQKQTIDPSVPTTEVSNQPQTNVEQPLADSTTQQQVEAPAVVPRKRRGENKVVQQQPQAVPPWYRVPASGSQSQQQTNRPAWYQVPPEPTTHSQSRVTSNPPWYRVPPKPVEVPSYQWKPPAQMGDVPARDGLIERTYEGGVKSYHAPFATPDYHQSIAAFHRAERDRLLGIKPQGIDQQLQHINMINGHLKAAMDHDQQAQIKSQKKPGFMDRLAGALASSGRGNFRAARGRRTNFGRSRGFSKAMPAGWTPTDPSMTPEQHQMLASHHKYFADQSRRWGHAALLDAHTDAMNHHLEQARIKSAKTGKATF